MILNFEKNPSSLWILLPWNVKKMGATSGSIWGHISTMEQCENPKSCKQENKITSNRYPFKIKIITHT